MRYMKEIMNGSRKYMNTYEVKFVSVPLYQDFKPENVLKKLNWQSKDKQKYGELLNFCPEIEYKGIPKDREFFFNVINTIDADIVQKMVLHGIEQRQKNPIIPDEMKIISKFQDIFTSSLSIIGNQGKCIQIMRYKHKSRHYKHKKRKRSFELKC